MAHHRHRPTLRRASALAIAALLALTVPAAAALAAPPEATDAALATERYYSSYDGAGAGRPDARSAALAAERYLSSYGAPEPLAAPSTPAPAGDGGPSWTASILGGALLILAAAGLGVLAHRLRPVHT